MQSPPPTRYRIEERGRRLITVDTYSGQALGLSATLTALTTSATSTLTGLGASTVRYTAAEADVAKQQDKVTDQSAQLTTRLTQQYASMNSRVSAYKSTQTFLTNQIAAWNKDS